MFIRFTHTRAHADTRTNRRLCTSSTHFYSILHSQKKKNSKKKVNTKHICQTAHEPNKPVLPSN
uniref:Uncharacterized protein n=1 Tax=Anguilla anguilla TaxID=7936 RepID=A0A0E9X122_ANGAN